MKYCVRLVRKVQGAGKAINHYKYVTLPGGGEFWGGIDSHAPEVVSTTPDFFNACVDIYSKYFHVVKHILPPEARMI